MPTKWCRNNNNVIILKTVRQWTDKRQNDIRKSVHLPSCFPKSAKLKKATRVKRMLTFAWAHYSFKAVWVICRYPENVDEVIVHVFVLQ